MRKYIFPIMLLSICVNGADIEKNGNVNINVIDRKVIVNGEVVKTIPKDEPINISVGNSSTKKTKAKIDNDKIEANIGDGISASIDGDNISANIGSIGASIIGGVISAKIKDKVKKKKDNKSSEDNFFGDDEFFK